MSKQFDEEERLFEIEEEKPAVRPPPDPKRQSWRTRFPIKSPPRGNSSSEGEMAGVTSGDKGEGGGVGPSVSSGRGEKGRGMGSMLGIPGLSVKENGSTLFQGKGENGEPYTIDVFHSVFSGRSLSSSQLEQLLNYLNVSGKLDFSTFIEGISYQGFDRLFYISAALKKVSVSVFCRFAVLGAVRGSNFQKIKEGCTDMPADLDGLVSSGTIIKKAKKRDDLTILRFTASIPHWVAFWLFSVDMSKKIESNDCPGWLQFPGAASLPMGKKQRLQHISFCKEFSSLLPGGTFNGNIYRTAYLNQIPAGDIPSMLKDQLGIGADSVSSGQITSEEVTEQVLMSVSRVVKT